MKKHIILIVSALLSLISCSKPFESSIELAVNDRRINIEYSQVKDQALEFVIPVYSTGSWTIRQVAGGDWLTLDRDSGYGRQYVHCTALANTADRVCAIKLELSNGSKTIPIYVVVSSSTLKASELDDADLDNYLI